MRGDEARVVDAFCRWLEAEGWQVTLEVDFVDVKAQRGADVLYAEAKGRTAAATGATRFTSHTQRRGPTPPCQPAPGQPGRTVAGGAVRAHQPRTRCPRAHCRAPLVSVLPGTVSQKDTPTA